MLEFFLFKKKLDYFPSHYFFILGFSSVWLFQLLAFFCSSSQSHTNLPPPSSQSFSFLFNHTRFPLFLLVSPSPKLISTPSILPSPPSLSSVIALRLHWLHLSWPWRAQCPLLSPNLGAATLATGLNTVAYVLFRRMALHNCDTHTDTHTRHAQKHSQVVKSCICIHRNVCGCSKAHLQYLCTHTNWRVLNIEFWISNVLLFYFIF